MFNIMEKSKTCGIIIVFLKSVQLLKKVGRFCTNEMDALLEQTQTDRQTDRQADRQADTHLSLEKTAPTGKLLIICTVYHYSGNYWYKW